MKALEENKIEEEKPAAPLNIALLIKAKFAKKVYSNMRKGISNIETNKLKHIIQPIQEQLQKLDYMEKRSKLEALEVLKEVKGKVSFYSIFNLVEGLSIKELEF